MSTRTPRRSQRGAALPFALVLTLVCAAVAAGSTMTHASAQKEALTNLQKERAFQAADGGLDWGLLLLRCANGGMPAQLTQARTLDNGETCTVTFQSCNVNSIDDDADGTTDEADEADFTAVRSTGVCGSARRSLRTIFSTRMNIPAFANPLSIANDAPVFTLNGNSFSVAGQDHDLTGTAVAGAPESYAITSEADPSVLGAQIPNSLKNKINGLGTEPSAGTMGPIDVLEVYNEMSPATNLLLEAGTHTHTDLGEPTQLGMRVVRCDGDLHLSSNCSGAGVLLVNGNLTVTGSFEWTGIIVVTGTCDLGGTGREKINGSLLVGGDLTISGNVDIKYSSTAVSMARKIVAIPRITTWIDATRAN